MEWRWKFVLFLVSCKYKILMYICKEFEVSNLPYVFVTIFYRACQWNIPVFNYKSIYCTIKACQLCHCDTNTVPRYLLSFGQIIVKCTATHSLYRIYSNKFVELDGYQMPKISKGTEFLFESQCHLIFYIFLISIEFNSFLNSILKLFYIFILISIGFNPFFKLE